MTNVETSERPASDDRKAFSLWVEMLGCEVRYYQGARWRLRGIEYGPIDAPALILLHGIGGHAEAWARNMKTLGRHFRVFALDLPHHGYSQKLPFEADMVSQYVDSLVDFIETQGLQSPHLEGESLGGIVAIHCLLRVGHLFGRVVVNTAAPVLWSSLTNTFVDNPEGQQKLARTSIDAIDDPSDETMRRRLEWLMHDPADVTDELVDLRREMYQDAEIRESMRRVYTTGLLERKIREHAYLPEEALAAITNPTLVLWSDHNPGNGREVGESMHRLIPGSEFHSIPDAAHWPQWERPEEHDRVVIDFLLGTSGPHHGDSA